MDNFWRSPQCPYIYDTTFELGKLWGREGRYVTSPSPDYRRFVNLINTLISWMRLFFSPENSTDFVFQKVPEAIQSKIVYFYSVINELRSRDVHSKWSDFEYRPWCLAIVVPTPPVRLARLWSSSLRGGWAQCVIAVPRGEMLCGRSSQSFSSPFFLQQDAEDSV